MVAVTLLGAANFASTNSADFTVTATPAVGDLIVVVGGFTGNTTITGCTDNNNGETGTYDTIQSALKATSADRIPTILVRTSLITAASSTVFTVSRSGASSGGGLAVFKVTGMFRTGAGAVRGSGKQENIASGTPAPVLTQAGLTANAVITAIANATNPAGTTIPTNFTDLVNVGYATPTTGVRVASRDSGNTAQTITWGGTSASAFASVAIELDASVPTELLVRGNTQSFDMAITRPPERVDFKTSTNRANPLYLSTVVTYAPCFPLEQDSPAKRKPKPSEFSQISLAQYYTPAAPQEMPYSQFNWPLAARRPPKIQSLDVVTNFVPFNLVDTLPFNQFGWPRPTSQRPKAQLLDTVTNFVPFSFVNRLPFNELDWALAAQPKPTVPTDQLFYPPQFTSAVAVTFAPCFPLEQDITARRLPKAKDFEQNLAPLQFISPVEMPKNVQEWPLAARAKARQDHQLAYSPTFLSAVVVQYAPCFPLEQDNYVRRPAPAKEFLQPNTLPILSSEVIIEYVFREPIFARGPRKLPSALPGEIFVNRVPLSEVVMPAGKSTSTLATKGRQPQAHRQEIFVNRSPFSPPEVIPVGASTSQLATKGRPPQAHRQEIFVNRLPITTVLKPFHIDDWQRPSPRRPYQQDQSTFHSLALQPDAQPFIPPPWQLPARKIRSDPGHNLSSPQLYFAAPTPTPEPTPTPRPRPAIRERVWDDYAFKSPFHRRNRR